MKYPGLLNKVETKEKVSDVITVQSVKDLPQNSKSGSIAEVTNKGVKKLEKDELLPHVFYIHVTNTDIGDIARTEDNLVLAILKDLKAAYYDLNHNKKIIPYLRVAILDLVYMEYEIQGDLLWKNLNNITIFVFNKNKAPYIYNGEEWEPMDYVQKSNFVFDSVPTENSSNLLTSGVIYNELSNKADLINGKVPSDLLPSYVDDVIEFPSFQEFPGIGESGKIYIDTSTNSCYRWTGSTYVEIPSAIVLDEYPTLDSENAVLSGGVYSALLEKLDIIPDLSEIILKAETALQTETDPTVPDWAKQSTKPSYDYSEINNTPTLATVATSGSYNDLSNKPTIPTVGTLNTNNSTALTVSSSESLSGAIKLHKVSKTGSYNDLLNKPTIPTVNNATLTIQKNGTNVATFTANASSNATANITVPTVTSDLTNDSGFLGDADVSYDANTKTLVIGAVYEDIWYAKVQSYGDEYTYEFLKENDNKWSVDNPYPTQLGYCDSIYFTYKGENYYATEIRDMVSASLSKTGNPVAVRLGPLYYAYITKDANDNFSIYFEAD